MKNKDVFWIVVLLFIAAPFLAIAGATKGVNAMDRKRKYTNLIGLVVLSVFVIAILGVQASKWVAKNAERSSTAKQLNQVAAGFADNNREIILKWGTGGYSDSWGGPLILESKDDEEGYRLLSKGPDGELGTEDDVSSRVHKPTPKKKVQDIFVKKPHVEKKKKKEKQPEKPSTFDRAKGWLKKKWDGDEKEN